VFKLHALAPLRKASCKISYGILASAVQGTPQAGLIPTISFCAVPRADFALLPNSE